MTSFRNITLRYVAFSSMVDFCDCHFFPSRLPAKSLIRDLMLSPENATLHFCNHFSFVPSHYACKMSSYYPGIKLV